MTQIKMKKKNKKNSIIIYNNIEVIPYKNRPFESEMNSAMLLPDGKIVAKRQKTKKKWLVGYWKYAK